MIDIVITTSAARIGGVVRQVGDRVSVPEHTAHAFVNAGRARLVEAVRTSTDVEVTTTSHHKKKR